MRISSTGRVLTAIAVGLSLVAIPAAADHAAGCASTDAAGEWTHYGNTAMGSRTQTAGTLDATTVADADVAWHFDAEARQPGAGPFHNTPVIAEGCAFVATNNGWVFALNADDGEVVWEKQIELLPLPDASETPSSGTSGLLISSVAVANDLVYVVRNQAHQPAVLALDIHTGNIVWDTIISTRRESFANSSPILYANDSLLFEGISSNEGSPDARGGYAIVDALSGDLLGEWFTISDADYAKGYRGASIWTTPAESGGFIYAGGGNPASKQIEHRHSNALLRIDGRPSLDDETPNPDFGQIVDAYKGNVDQYYPGLDRQPVCEQAPTELIWSPTCVQLDIDFGASVNLWVEDGELMLGALQKSGTYHTLWAETMQVKWTTIAGEPCAACNAASTAVDDASVYAAGTPGAVLFSIRRHNGRYNWALPLADGVHFQSVSSANGVAYAVAGNGLLVAVEDATGLPVWVRHMAVDAGIQTNAIQPLSSSGIAIARDTIYAASGPHLIAYN